MMSIVVLCVALTLIRLGPRRIFRTSRCQLTENLAGLHEDRGLAAGRLVATHDDVDVERIELDTAADAAGFLCGDEGRPGPEERVQHDVASVGKVEERVLDHCGRLNRRMVLEASARVRAQRGGAGISPDVRAPAALLAEFDIVDVRGGSILKQRQELVLGAIEAAHARIGLGPYDEIERVQVEAASRLMDDWIASPVDEGA